MSDIAGLEAPGEAATVAWRHLDRYGPCRGAARHSSDPASLAAVDDELDNVRAALRWSLYQRALPASPRLASRLGPSWYVNARAMKQRRVWLEEALSLRVTAGRRGGGGHDDPVV